MNDRDSVRTTMTAVVIVAIIWAAIMGAAFYKMFSITWGFYG